MEPYELSKERQSFICCCHEDCTAYGVEEGNNPEEKLENRDSSAHQTALFDTFACFSDFSLTRLHFVSILDGVLGFLYRKLGLFEFLGMKE